jgi:hypothetical protein
LLRRSQKLIERLDPEGNAGWFRSALSRPRGMHRRTYERLCDDELAFRFEGICLMLGSH